MPLGDSETSRTSAPWPAWLPSVAPIEESYRVEFRVRIGGDTLRTEGESAQRFQMTEKWNDEIFGTGGSGLKMSLLREEKEGWLFGG